jgi:hypothetical protein
MFLNHLQKFLLTKNEKNNDLFFLYDKQMNRLNNTTVLPVKIGTRTYATTEHYVLSSLLKDIPQDLVLSYPLDKARQVFNYHDQEQYKKIIYEASNKFNEKKCRSIQRQDGKTIGSIARQLLKDNMDFLYKTESGPFQSVIGLTDVENVLYGYNLVGHSLLRMKHLVEKLPDLSGPMEYIFWKSHPEKEKIPAMTSPKTYRTILPKKKKPIVDDAQEEPSLNYVYEEMGENDEEYEPEEQAYNPEEVPVYTNDRVRWIATNPNSRLDDLREIGAQADFLYTMDAPLSDPFQAPADLYSRTDPLYIFKIYKATEHLVDRMKNGMDIKAFLNRPVDAILWECKVSPELFGIDPRSLGPKQRNMIYVEYWRRFMSKTIPFYSFIEKEVMYPQNLAGFIRQEYTQDLNERIGAKIKEILFASFVYQVIERSYPHVAPEMRIIVLTREMKQFTEEEYIDITDRLYHLFFEGKFLLDEEGKQRILTHEAYRLSTQEMEEALHFVPCKILSAPATDIQGTVLDPLAPADIVIDDKVFHDLYQYIYYRLLISYGSLTQDQAYEHLFHQGSMVRGDDPRLAKRLQEVVMTRKKELVKTAYLAKYEQYPQVQEMVLYSRASNNRIHEEGDDTVKLWNEIPTNPLDLELMKWVVKTIPANSNHHFEKSVHLYAFLHDLVRSLNLMKSVVGRRLQKKPLEVFFRCFYHKVRTIQQGVKVPKTKMPPEFSAYIGNTKTVHEEAIEDLWRMVFPIVYLFQQKKFDPTAWHQEAKMTMSLINKQDFIQALSRVVHCLYPEQEVSNDHFYLITQMISGKDDIPMWPDPSFEMIREVEEGESLGHLPEEIRKRLPKKKSNKKKMETVQYNIVHPSFAPLQKKIQEAFHRPAIYDPVVSRASYALAALQKETVQPRRIVFYI